MIDLTHPSIDQYRLRGPDIITRFGSEGDSTCGTFLVPGPFSTPTRRRRSPSRRQPTLRVIASADQGWDHVSVSLAHRTPTWQEMSHIHSLFFLPHETAMQLHVPAEDHINCHPHCLHLWRPHHLVIPRPPSWMVGPTSKETR